MPDVAAVRKSSNIQSARITLSCTENHLVIVLQKNYSETMVNRFETVNEMRNSPNNSQLLAFAVRYRIECCRI